MANKAAKTPMMFVLRKHTESTIPLFRRVSKDHRVRLEKRPYDMAYLQITFEDVDEINKTIRFKMNANSIYLDDQVKAGIPATMQEGNRIIPYPFTPSEYEAMKFTNGILRTTLDMAQKYLMATPQNGNFKGYCSIIKQPLFDLYDKTLETKIQNDDFRLRLKAANKINEINDLKVAQDLMYRLNGSFFKAPGQNATTPEEIANALEECRRGLINFMDDAEEEGLYKLLEDVSTADEQVMILVGKAVQKEILAFDQTPNQVTLNTNGVWKNVKMISSTIPPNERQRLFAEFLASPEAKVLYDDIDGRVNGKPATTKKQKEQLVNS